MGLSAVSSAGCSSDLRCAATSRRKFGSRALHRRRLRGAGPMRLHAASQFEIDPPVYSDPLANAECARLTWAVRVSARHTRRARQHRRTRRRSARRRLDRRNGHRHYLGPVRPRHPPGHRGIEIVVAGWQSADGPRPGDDFPTIDDIHRIFLRPPPQPRKLFPRPLDQVIY
jgi:hypothetical protein